MSSKERLVGSGGGVQVAAEYAAVLAEASAFNEWRATASSERFRFMAVLRIGPVGLDWTGSVGDYY
jgi:hypothetical protein